MAHGYADGIDPHAFVIVDDKLYLNLTQGINNAFIRNLKVSIKRGDKVWPGLSARLIEKSQDPESSYWGGTGR